MKVLWCWRCGMDVPMLDEEEFEQVARVHQEVMERFRASRRKGEKAFVSVEDILAPVCAEYMRLTGFHERNVNAVLHHRLRLYGPPSTRCGKPLRSPRARYCAACGEDR
jgi:hypothetical protein